MLTLDTSIAMLVPGSISPINLIGDMLIFLRLNMTACICGGFLEIGYVIVMAIISISGAIFGTNWYNKLRYEKYVEYKNKHKSCDCDCHKDD